MFLVKQKCILLRWPTRQVPTFNMWIFQICVPIVLDKLTHYLNHGSDRFRRLWEPTHSYLRRLWPIVYPRGIGVVCPFIYFIFLYVLFTYLSPVVFLLTYCFYGDILHSSYCCFGVGLLFTLFYLFCFVLF